MGRRNTEAGRQPETGWNAVTVPGAVSAWVALSAAEQAAACAFGPTAIDYARNGFPVSPTIARVVALGADAKLGSQPGFAECFLPAEWSRAKGGCFAVKPMRVRWRRDCRNRGRLRYRGVIESDRRPCASQRRAP